MIKKSYRNCHQNKALIATVSFYMMAYAKNKYTNLFQMVTSYFIFTHNVSKRGIDVYYKMGLIILYKTVWQILNANKQAILRLFCKKVNVKQFFLSYDNINFYKKVQDQRIYNKYYQIAYTTGYICFMKDKASFFCYIIDYKAVNKLIPSDFLLTLAEFQHQTKATHYILSQVLSQYFEKEIYKEHIIINGI